MKVAVEGKPCEARAGESILALLARNGIEVPQLCYHPSLGPLQTCDTCLVEVGGRLVRACATPVQDGMQVAAQSGHARKAQLDAMAEILRNHNMYCTVCDNNNGDCVLHNTVYRMGIESQAFEPKGYPVDDSSPFYVYDPDQCIACGRCVEACQNLVVNEVLSLDWSQGRPRVVWDRGAAVDRSSCVSCGTCCTVCPVNALMEKSILGQAGYVTGILKSVKDRMVDAVKEVETSFSPLMLLSTVEGEIRKGLVKKTKTVCTFCGVGCTFDVWTRDRKVLLVQPSPESPANAVATCVKGKFGWDFVNSPDRLVEPLIRTENGSFREASWEEALALVARRFSEVKAKDGPDAIGVIASCTGTNEESYLTQKLARAVIGTNNVDNCSRYCQSPATMGLWRTVGYGGDSGGIEDIEAADLVVIVGSNTAEAHPVLASRVKRARKLHGQKLAVLDLRRHEMAERADLFLRPNPGTDLVVLNAIGKYVLDQGWEAKEFIASRTNGFAEFQASLEPFTLDYAEKVTGLPRDQIIRLAAMIHESKGTCILWAMGVTQHQDGSETSTAIANLLLLTGNFGRTGTGGYPLRGHANVQGVSDFGSLTGYLPGYQKTSDPEVRKKFEAAWGVRLPEGTGLNSEMMVLAAEEGKLRAMYLMGEDKILADSDQGRMDKVLSGLEFLVVQELFLTRTAQYADVVLPAAASLEKEGTFVSTERRVQRLYKALEPLGGSKPDWAIIQGVARALGADWDYTHPSQVMEELAPLTPMFAGVTYERLEGFHSLQWPIAADGSCSSCLYTERFAFPDGKARFYVTKFIEPIPTSKEFDLYLNNGRMLEHFHWGNLTWRNPGLVEKVPEMFVEVSPELAASRGLKDGDTVRLTSPAGSAKTKVLVTDRVSGNVLFLPEHGQGEAAVNRLSTDKVDPSARTPAYKEIPVRMEKLESCPVPTPPLPRTNPRFARRNPRPGVEVEKKWARPDYVPPEKR